MGLDYGCSESADEAFKNRHKLGAILVTDSRKTVHLRGSILGECTLGIAYTHGDCTACMLYLEYLKPEKVNDVFTIVQEYMAINARISGFFTKRVSKDNIQKWLDALKPFEICGLHVHKSNREPDLDYYQITGILKVPNPVVKEYKTWDKEYPKDHDLHDATHFNEVNKSFNLQTV